MGHKGTEAGSNLNNLTAWQARALSRFQSLTHRGSRVGFSALGPVVASRNPAELEEATARALAELADTMLET
jgi:hypothetical protein